MRESGYYPPGAEFDPDAPYNEVELPEITRECEAHFEVKRNLDIATREYVCYGFDDEDTSYVDWKNEYIERHYDPVELIGALADVARRRCEENIPQRERNRIRRLLREAEGWEIEDMTVEEA